MRVEAKWHGKRAFTAIGPSNRTVEMDASADVGGEESGVRPMELVLMGLVGCTGIDISLILERMRQPLKALHIEADGIRREAFPQKFTEIYLTYHLDGDISADKAWRAIHLSEEKYCSASASLNAVIVPRLVLNGSACADPNEASSPAD